MSKRVFFTGGNGFLGAYWVKHLSQAGYIVDAPNSRECNLLEYDNLLEYSSNYDFVIHLAAWTQAGDFCLYHQGEQWLHNQLITSNIVKWWREKQSQAKFVFMGTSCSYAPDLPLKEEYYLSGTPIESLYTYAMTKRMLLIGAKSLSQQFGMEYVSLIPSTLYGPSYHTDGRQMHFIFDLIRKILRGKHYGETVELWGDGSQKRELVFVKDFVKLGTCIMQDKKNEIFNIGGGSEYSIKDFAIKICNITGYDFTKIKYDTSKYVGAKSKFLNVEKVEGAYSEFKSTSLDEGLRETIEWFENEKVYSIC